MKWRSLEESAQQTDHRPLSEIYADRKGLIAKYVPVETQRVHARAVEQIKQQGIEGRALQTGATAPRFTLQDQNARTLASADILAQGPLVVIFFRGRWCPFCVAQLEAMNLVVDEIEQAGATLVAVSPQTVKQAFFMAEQHKLRYPLLSDSGNLVAREFGMVYRVPNQQQQIYRSAFVNLPFANGDESWELPIPAVYVIGRDGYIVYSSASADYTERPEPAEILDVVKTLTADKKGAPQSRNALPHFPSLQT